MTRAFLGSQPHSCNVVPSMEVTESGPSCISDHPALNLSSAPGLSGGPREGAAWLREEAGVILKSICDTVLCNRYIVWQRAPESLGIS